MRWILRIAAALVIFVLVAVGLLFLLPADRIGQIASDQLERQTGRKLTLSGEFRPSLYPVLGARTGALSVSNAEWAGDDPMLSAEGVAVGVDLVALLQGDIRVRTLRLDTPIIRLVRAADGRTNWTFKGAASTDTGTTGGTTGTTNIDRLSLEDGEITNGRIVYTDLADGGHFDIDRLTGTLSIPADQTMATTRFEGRVNTNPVKVALVLNDRVAALAGKPSDITLSVSVLDTGLDFSGTFGLLRGSPVLNGKIVVAAANPGAIAQRFGTVLPEAIRPLRDIRFDGTLNMADALTLAGNYSGSLRGTPLSGRATVQAEPGWAAALAFETDVTLEAGALANLSFSGGLSGTGKNLVNGSLDLDIADIPATLSVIGQRFSPPPGALRRASYKGPVQFGADSKLTLPGGAVSVDQNQFTGDLTVALASKPFVTANLSGQALDFSALTGNSAGSGAGGAPAASDGWSREPIAVEGLDAIDGDITLRAQSINLGPTQLGKTDLTAKLRDGRMDLTLREVLAYGGKLSGTATVTGGKQVAFTSDLDARGMQLEPLLGQFAGITRLTGTGATKLKLRANGASVHALMNSLSGTGEVELGSGTIKGIDLGAMMQNLKAAFGGFDGATEFSSLTGTFRMDRGVLQNVDLSLITPLFRAGGRGSVDVGGRAMNYEVTPTRFAEGAKFSVPVTIVGPWSNLKFRPDLESLVDLLANGEFATPEELEAAKKKLAEVKAVLDDPGSAVEDKLKRELNKRLTEDLKLPERVDGGTRTANADPTAPAPSVEDQIKDQVRRKVLNELGLGDGGEEPTPAAPAVNAFETATDLAMSTPGIRPRTRPGSIRPVAAQPTPSQPAAPAPDNRTIEEQIKDDLEDRAKNELKKLLKIGN